jgi:glycosyltransferase involved in cell wall biosynthesis
MASVGGSMKTKILLIGPLLTRSGYGEQARFALRALRSREDIYDIYIHPLQWGQTSWISEYNEEKQWIDDTIEKTILYLQQGGSFDSTLQVTIPNEWKRISAFDVGYTAGIETSKVSHEWIQAANKMDKMVVVSQHSKSVFESTVYSGVNEQTGETVSELSLEIPIDFVGYPTKNISEIQDLELPLSTEFNFLSIAQFGPRKNMINMIKWFIEEFHDDSDVGLVVKTNRSKNSLMDREFCEGTFKQISQEYPDKKCRLYLLHGDMSDDEMHSLYANEKISAFVGIPHGEGFGLPLFEAAYMGLPVVATGWSGQLDFLCDEKGKEHFYNVAYDIAQVSKEVVWPGVLIAESAWAYAREGSYKQQMRNCRNDVANNKGFAAKSCEYAVELHERFSEKTMYEKFTTAIVSEDREEWGANLSEIEII